MIKLLAIDLDDTLLDDTLCISDANKQAIAAALDCGVEVMLASGRTLFAMEKYAAELSMSGKPGYIITNNGATVYETAENRCLYSRNVPVDAALAAWEIACRHGLTMQYYGYGIIYTSRKNLYTDRDCDLSGQRYECVPDFARALHTEQTKFVIPGDPLLLPAVEKELKEVLAGRCNIFISKPYFLEVLEHSADKGTALSHIAGLKGCQASEVMAIGDSMNDYGMIRWAGTGIVMSNGLEKIKAVADGITRFSHNEDGVAWAIENYILSPQGRSREVSRV